MLVCSGGVVAPCNPAVGTSGNLCALLLGVSDVDLLSVLVSGQGSSCLDVAVVSLARKWSSCLLAILPSSKRIVNDTVSVCCSTTPGGYGGPAQKFRQYTRRPDAKLPSATCAIMFPSLNLLPLPFCRG